MRRTYALAIGLYLFTGPFATVPAGAQDIPVTGHWTPIGPGGGGGKQSSGISSADPNVVIATSDVGGIFRTQDGGQNWTISNSFFIRPNGGMLYSLVADVVFAPTDPNYVMVGSYRSTDYGRTFDRAGATEFDISTAAATFDPSDKNIRYIAPIEGVNTSRLIKFVGTTRNAMGFIGPCPGPTPLAVTSLVAFGGNTFFAASNCGLYKSTDGGATFVWAPGSGFPNNAGKGINKLVKVGSNGLVAALTTDPGVGGKNYASPGTPWDGGIYYSSDSAFTWIDASGVTDPPFDTNSGFEGTIFFPGGWEDWSSPGGSSIVGQQCPIPSNCHLILINGLAGNAAVAVSNLVQVKDPSQSFHTKRYRVAADVTIDNDVPNDPNPLTIGLLWYTSPTSGWTLQIVQNVNKVDAPTSRRFEADVIPPSSASYVRLMVTSYDPAMTAHVDNLTLSPTTALPRGSNYRELASDGFGNIYAAVLLGSGGPALEAGVWRSTNFGGSWDRVTRFLNIPDLQGHGPNVTKRRAIERGRESGFDSQSLSMGSGAGNQTLYLGTGLWLYKTTDGGTTWTETVSNWNGLAPNNDKYRSAFNDIGVRSIALDVKHRSRLFYGDEDNAMLVSEDLDPNGVTPNTPNFQLWYPPEIIAGSAPIASDTATSIVIDPNDADHLFVAAALRNELIAAGKPSGVVEVRRGAGTPWSSWSRLSPLPVTDNPGISMVLDSTVATPMLYAAAIGKGVFRRDAYGFQGGDPNVPKPWESLTSFTPVPTGWWATSAAKSPANGRIYVGFGNPGAPCFDDGRVPQCYQFSDGTWWGPPAGGTGVWMTDSAAGGTSWTKIFPPPTIVDNQVIASLYAAGSDTLYVGTRLLLGAPQVGGGLYKGTCTTSCGTIGNWTWTKKIPTANVSAFVTGIAGSPRSSRVLYALVSQNPTFLDTNDPNSKAGLWLSRDKGETWSYVKNDPNSPLMSLASVILGTYPPDPNAVDEPLTVFAGTNGTGLFQGQVTCDLDAAHPSDPVTGDWDGDGISNYCDNCKAAANPLQEDTDENGIGDACQSPVAAYNFNAGSGNNLLDVSGHGNNGTIQGATWVAGGHDGNALSFNGINNTGNKVTIGDSNSLDLTYQMTLEAWVRPTILPTNWRAILQKRDDAYFLNASTNQMNHFGAGGTFGGVCCGNVYGPSQLAAQQWAHVASTYDGITLRLYLNGTEVSSTPKTGTLQVNGNALILGGNITYPTEYFNGRIDNLRIYNRALSAAEIVLDMNTPP